jgi:hypothetical protein
VAAVLLASEFDDTDDGQGFISVRRKRIGTPDTRSRLYGYLATAPLATPGFRTDGDWVWPLRLADYVREHGTAPQEQLYQHLQQRYFLLPEDVGENALWEAAVVSAGPAVPDPAPDQDWTYQASYDGPDATATDLFRTGTGSDGAAVEYRYAGGGWRRSYRTALVERGVVHGRLEPVSGRLAADIANQLSDRMHAGALAEARESVALPGQLRLARVFDGADPTGNAWFSPARLRLPEPIRRQRIATYLNGGRLVMRVAGQLPDPWSGSDEPVVPLNYRTDGTWVWSDALAYYLLRRGVAPELDFLCHIESMGYAAAPSVPDEVASAAVALATAPPAPPPVRVPMTYYQEPWGVVCRARHGDPHAADVYRMDRRWGPTSDLSDQLVRGEDNGYEVISEADAVRALDARWPRDDAQPPLD